MTEERQPPRGRVPLTAARRRQHRCTPFAGSEGGKTRRMQGVRRHGYCTGDRSLFKGGSPHSRPKASRAKTPPDALQGFHRTTQELGPTCHTNRPKTRGGRTTAHEACNYPAGKHSLILTETSGRKGGPPLKKHTTAPRLCTLSASSHPAVRHGGPGPHVM
jgi:hypothetical protein